MVQVYDSGIDKLVDLVGCAQIKGVIITGCDGESVGTYQQPIAHIGFTKKCLGNKVYAGTLARMKDGSWAVVNVMKHLNKTEYNKGKDCITGESFGGNKFGTKEANAHAMNYAHSTDGKPVKMSLSTETDDVTSNFDVLHLPTDSVSPTEIDVDI